jgi:hypothetical protein
MRILACALMHLMTFVFTAQAALTAVKMDGFCEAGSYPTTTGKEIVAARQTWGSYCKAGDQTTGDVTTSWFKAPDRMRLYFAGYPNGKDLELALVRADNSARLKVKVAVAPAETWQPSDFDIPRDWRGRTVRLQGLDRNVSVQGWFAFSEPVPAPSHSSHWIEAMDLGGRTLLHFFLEVLPCFVALLVAVRCGVREPLVLALIGLATLAAVGYGAVWAWFLSPRIGRVLGFLLPIVSIALGLKLSKSLSRADWKLFRRMLSPLALTLSATLLFVFACFAYGGLDDANTTARYRFRQDIPADNELPFRFASGLIAGKVPSPIMADWLPSDRPPLQSGMFLAHMPYLSKPRALDYTIVGISLQSLWLFAMWIFLSAHGLDRRLIALVLGVCLFSGFTLLNTTYVWPKLLAAAYTIAGASVLLGNKLESIRNRPLGWALAGALLAFGILAHGGTVFATLALFLLVLLLRRIPNARSCWAALATMAILYLPWFLYQKFVDPPGDRLLKWHIAGVVPVTPQPFARLLVQSYRTLTLSEVAKNKIENVKTVLGDDPALLKSFVNTWRGVWIGGDNGATAIVKNSVDARTIKWFHFLPELDVLGLGFLAMAVGLVPGFRTGFHTVAWRFSLLMAAWVALTILSWCVLMFFPRSTVLHQGSYAIVLLGYAACLSAAWAVSRRFAITLGLLHVFINIVYYLIFLHADEIGYLTERSAWPGVLVFTVLAACAAVYQLFRIELALPPIPL